MSTKKPHYYAIRIHANKDFPAGVYSVSKLDEDLVPLATYTTCTKDQIVPKCNCPAYKVPCKHIKMVKDYHKTNPRPKGLLNGLTGRFEEVVSL